MNLCDHQWSAFGTCVRCGITPIRRGTDLGFAERMGPHSGGLAPPSGRGGETDLAAGLRRIERSLEKIAQSVDDVCDALLRLVDK